MTGTYRLRFEAEDDNDISGDIADNISYIGRQPAWNAGHSYSHQRQKQEIKNGYSGAKTGRKAAENIPDSVRRSDGIVQKLGEFAKNHSKGLIIAAVIGVVLLILLGIASALSAVIESTVSGVSIATYPSADADMLAAEEKYLQMERRLKDVIENYEATHIYTEYSYDIDEIYHNPYALISAITAIKGGGWDIYEADDIMNMLFSAQYTLKESTVSETRYSTELRQGIIYYTDINGNPVPYEYQYYENVPYQYTGVRVTLRNNGLENILRDILTDEQKAIYDMYMESLGNRPDLFTATIYPDSPDSDDLFNAMMKEAEKYIGYPYVWGGSSPETSFDCSGYVCWVLNHSGWNIGRTNAQGLYNMCTPIPNTSVKPGDLVFFKGTYNTPNISHVGIYVGNGMMINAGDPIGYDDLNSSYWRSHLYAYGRLPRP